MQRSALWTLQNKNSPQSVSDLIFISSYPAEEVKAKFRNFKTEKDMHPINIQFRTILSYLNVI